VVVWRGTALAAHFDHRISYDVDIFMPNADWISDLAPNANPKTRALIGDRKYEFPGNYLKLKLDAGEIDFIVASKRTNQPTQAWDFEGRTIPIETPWEIAATADRGVAHLKPSTFRGRVGWGPCSRDAARPN